MVVPGLFGKYDFSAGPTDRPAPKKTSITQHLALLRRRPTKDRALLAAAYQAANAKARELGWIV